MKAIVYHRYGGPDVVALAEVPKPVPKDNEVLVHIRATTVTSADWRARSLKMPPGFGVMARLVFGHLQPRQPILGTELAGEIEAIGRAVTRFGVGDPVFAFTGAAYGCHAEYRTLPEDGLIALKPENLSFEEAAALAFGGTTALAFLRHKAGITSGDRVLVVGASGGVGSAAVQIASHFGADVTGVCSTANVGLVRSIGANRAIDYTQQDFALGDETYDIIVDTTGTVSFARCEAVLRPGGRLVVVLASLATLLGIGRPSKASGKAVIASVAAVSVGDMEFLARLAETGAYKPVIDRSYPLADAAKAHGYVDTGRKRGSVILTIAHTDRGTGPDARSGGPSQAQAH